MVLGIFLVESFRNIIERNLDESGYIKDNDKFEKLIVNNIYGIDINQEAVDVTIFSLYLTMLDYKDPKTLENFKFPNLINTNLFVSDFFDNEINKTLENMDFKFIIGNPPWGRINKGEHIQYCKRNNYKLQSNEISMSFIYKVKELCKENTTCCLVLPSKLLYKTKNPSKNLRKILLSESKIEKVIELSSVRKLLFKGAIAPSAVVIFKKDNTNYLENKLEHISFKPNIFFALFNLIVLERNDIKFVPQKFLRENDWAWKTMTYGTSFDIKIIQDLKKSYKSIASVINESGNIITGVGISTSDGERKDSRNYIGKLILDTEKGIDSFYINTKNAYVFNKSYIHRIANEKLFKPPYCLVKKGVNCDNYKMRAAYSEEEFLYRDGSYSLKGSMKEKDILLNLTGIINSSFYAYLNLMLASSIGIEREQRFPEEFEQFPYIYDKSIVEKVQEIQKVKSTINMKEASNEDILIEELDRQILEKVGLNNNDFIDYALNVQIPLINGKRRTLIKEVRIEDMERYSLVFREYFNRILKRINKFCTIILYPKIMGMYSVFELIIDDKKPKQQTIIKKDINKNKELLSRFMITRNNDLFYQIKDVINFEENSFFIIKTNEYKNWHPAMAHIDLSEVIDEMLSRKWRHRINEGVQE